MTALRAYLCATASRITMAMVHAARARGYRTNILVEHGGSAHWWVRVHETKHWPDMSLAQAQRLRII